MLFWILFGTAVVLLACGLDWLLGRLFTWPDRDPWDEETTP